MSLAKQTINAYVQVRLNDLEYKEANELAAVGLDISGRYIADSQGNYVASANSVKEAVHALDLQLYSVATTYATMATTASTITGITGTPSELLNTLKKIDDSINNDASFASNFLSTIGGEIATATAAEEQLRTDLSGEVIRSIPVEDLLRSDLSGQIVFATAADAQLTTDLSGEIVRASQVESHLITAVSDTITARVQAVNDLSTSFDSRLMDLSGTFYTGIANEVERATAADSQITTDLSGEIQRSVSEDISYRTDMSGEILRASTADAQLTLDLYGEVQRATAAEEALSGRMDTIETYYIPKDPLTKVATGSFDLSGNKIVNVADPVDDNDLPNKKYVDDSVNSLGDVFSYRDSLDLGVSNDLTTVSHKERGAAYKILGTGPVVTNKLMQGGSPDPGGYANVNYYEKSGVLIYSIMPSEAIPILNVSNIVTDRLINVTPGTQENPTDLSLRNVKTDFSDMDGMYYRFTQDGYVLLYTYTDDWVVTPIQVFQNDILAIGTLNFVLNPDDSTQLITTINGVNYYTVRSIYYADQLTKSGGPTLIAASNATDGNSVVMIDYTQTPGNYARSFTAGYFKIMPLDVVQNYKFNSNNLYQFQVYNSGTSIYIQQIYTPISVDYDISNTTLSSPKVMDELSTLLSLYTIYSTSISYLKFTSHGFIKYRINTLRYDDGVVNEAFASAYPYIIQEVFPGDYLSFSTNRQNYLREGYSGNFYFIKQVQVDSQPTSTVVTPTNFLFNSSFADGYYIFNVSQSGYAALFQRMTELAITTPAKNGDIFVSDGAGNWDVLNNSDIVVNKVDGRTALSGDGFNGYSIDISGGYVGQWSLTTAGTVTTGTWQATTLATTKGGTGQTTYAKGDLLLGNSTASLDKLAAGADGTFLKSDGANASWVPEDTENISLTSATNFPSLATLQESLDSLYDSFQKRTIVQFVVQSSTDYANATTPNTNLLSGKVNFINYNASNTSIYLPPSDIELVDGTIIRLVHNGDYNTENMIVKYKDVDANEDVSVVEIAPHDTTAFVWNAGTAQWLVGIGI